MDIVKVSRFLTLWPRKAKLRDDETQIAWLGVCLQSEFPSSIQDRDEWRRQKDTNGYCALGEE